jgi:hypothetical protein
MGVTLLTLSGSSPLQWLNEEKLVKGDHLVGQAHLSTSMELHDQDGLTGAVEVKGRGTPSASVDPGRHPYGPGLSWVLP